LSERASGLAPSVCLSCVNEPKPKRHFDHDTSTTGGFFDSFSYFLSISFIQLQWQTVEQLERRWIVPYEPQQGINRAAEANRQS
jgi:hypothetical protein